MYLYLYMDSYMYTTTGNNPSDELVLFNSINKSRVFPRLLIFVFIFLFMKAVTTQRAFTVSVRH